MGEFRISCNFDTISVREETSNLRNILFKACFTEFCVIQSSIPISLLVKPRATSWAIWISRDVRQLEEDELNIFC